MTSAPGRAEHLATDGETYGTTTHMVPWRWHMRWTASNLIPQPAHELWPHSGDASTPTHEVQSIFFFFEDTAGAARME